MAFSSRYRAEGPRIVNSSDSFGSMSFRERIVLSNPTSAFTPFYIVNSGLRELDASRSFGYRELFRENLGEYPARLAAMRDNAIVSSFNSDLFDSEAI
jgi:hypothetical protein